MATMVEAHVVPELEENRARRAARINRPKWSPKQWHPVYEEVVLLDMLGYKNIVIAEMKGFTKEHISNILNTPQAKLIKELTVKRMEKKREETIEQRLDRLANKAMERLEETINNDELAAKNPLGLFDRAITVLKSTNNIKEQPTSVDNSRTIIVTDAQMEKLNRAMALSDEAKQLNSGLKPAEGIEIVVDSDVEDAVTAP